MFNEVTEIFRQRLAKLNKESAEEIKKIAVERKAANPKKALLATVGSMVQIMPLRVVATKVGGYESYGLAYFIPGSCWFVEGDGQGQGRCYVNKLIEKLAEMADVSVVRRLDDKEFNAVLIKKILLDLYEGIEIVKTGKVPPVLIPEGLYWFKFIRQWAGGGCEGKKSEASVLIKAGSLENAFEALKGEMVGGHENCFENVRIYQDNQWQNVQAQDTKLGYTPIICDFRLSEMEFRVAAR